MLLENIAVNLLHVLRFEDTRRHSHTAGRPFCSLAYRVHSDSRYLYRGKSVRAETGAVSFVPAGVDYETETRGSEAIVFHFELYGCTSDEIQAEIPPHPEEYRVLFEKALQIWTEKKSGYAFRATALFYEVLALLVRDGCFRTSRKQSFAEEACEYMKRHFADATLTVSALAERSHVSEVYFRKQFKKRYGIGPKAYLDELRLRHAAYLRDAGYFSLTEIAERCGYSDVKYFRTVFKAKLPAKSRKV